MVIVWVIYHSDLSQYSHRKLSHQIRERRRDNHLFFDASLVFCPLCRLFRLFFRKMADSTGRHFGLLNASELGRVKKFQCVGGVGLFVP